MTQTTSTTAPTEPQPNEAQPNEAQPNEAQPNASSGRAGLRRRVLWSAGAAIALVLILVFTWYSPASTSTTPLAPDNPDPDGARAAAEILQERGVSMRYVRSTAAVLADARPEGTVLITQPHLLRAEQIEALREAPGDIVVAGRGDELLAPTGHARIEAGGADVTRDAGCQDPHASAAEQVRAPGPLVVATEPDVEVCFEAPGETGGLYASWVEGGRTWRVLSNADLLRNDRLAEHGHAALVLRSLGQRDHVTWYVPDPDDDFGLQQESAVPPMPLLAGPVVAITALTILALILWRGRRLGPLVTEHLPVVIKATETTRGRGRLYRRHETFAHAGAALRAGAIARCAGPLGLSRTAAREDVVQALARATGRPADQIDAVLYSPPPHDDASLAALAHALQTMESEVHRR